MTFQDKIKELKQEIFNLISTKEISYLYNLDKRIDVNRLGKFNYYNFSSELHSGEIWKYLQQLEDDRIYALIPIMSKNVTPDEPFIVLSQTILITKNSDINIIIKHIWDKTDKTCELYDIDLDNSFKITFKYKEVKFDYFVKSKFK